MKHALLATTALILSAGLAHAQAFTITGEARMGIQYDSTGAFLGSNWRHEQRLDLNFNVAVQADHGLAFGAWTRARMETTGSGTAQGGVFSAARVWVEANGLRLTFGNTDGALATYGASHGYLGGCGVGYEYGIWCGDSAGLLAVSAMQNNLGSNFAPQAMLSYSNGNFDAAVFHRRGGVTEVAIRGRFGAVTVAAGHTNALGGASTISAHYNGGSWGVGAIASNAGAMTNWSVSGTMQAGGGTAYAYVGREYGASTLGLNYALGLGGGATLMIGAERIGTNTLGSLGVTVSF